MLDQAKNNNKKIKKSHILLFGSLLIFLGIIGISFNYLVGLSEKVIALEKANSYDELDDTVEEESEIVTDVPTADNLKEENNEVLEPPKEVDFSKYLGVLEIPKIGLKRGFYDLSSPYNNIEKNVTLVHGSRMPDVENGNLMLMAHSGTAYISYFNRLYRLKIGDSASITYNGKKYKYKVVDIYDVEKNGSVQINRNYSKNTLTLITCTINDDTKQTIYILEA